MTSTSSYEAIVIGCGAAGAAALATLAQGGRSVLGLEAAARVGGRVHSAPFGDGVVEIGAEWIHGESPNRVYDLAMQNGVPLMKQTMDLPITRSDGTTVDKNMTDELLGYCLDVMGESQDNLEPLGNFVVKKVNEFISDKPSLAKDKDFVDEFFAFANLLVGNFRATNDWNDVTNYSDYESMPGHQHWSWHKLGYKTLFDLLLNTKSDNTPLPVDIHLNKEVTSIHWPRGANQKVAVTCADGSTYSANSAIVTLSLGVLKERHETLFDPKLPEEKIEAINSIPMGVMDKIILSYDEPWWADDTSFQGFVWKSMDKVRVPEEDLWTTKIFGCSVPCGSGNCLTLWTSGDIAKLVESLPEATVVDKCTELLRKFVGPHVPAPAAIIRSTWYSDPYTRGSYSFDSIHVKDASALRAALAAPILDEAKKPKLLFAGEATNRKCFATVHGAMDSGIREAQNVLNSL